MKKCRALGDSLNEDTHVSYHHTRYQEEYIEEEVKSSARRSALARYPEREKPEKARGV